MVYWLEKSTLRQGCLHCEWQDATGVMDGSLLEVTTVLSDDRTNFGSRSNRTLTILEERRMGVILRFFESTSVLETRKGLELSGKTVIGDSITDCAFTDLPDDKP